MKEFQNFFENFFNEVFERGLGEWLFNSEPVEEDFFDETVSFLEDKYCCEIFYGTSRTVFVFRKLKWVLKIPRKKQGVNDCDIEELVFQLAKREGLERFFAKPAKFLYERDYEVLPVYVMKKAETNEERVSEHFYSYYDMDCEDDAFIEEWFQKNFEEEQAVKAAFRDYYGERVMNVLYDFLSTLGINDIHCGNVGYDDEDNLVFIDYAGYNNRYDDGVEERKNKIIFLWEKIKG